MAPLSCYGAQYEEMISELDPNATMDTPVSLQELHDAYSRLMGGHMRLKKLLAKMMASYPVKEIEEVFAARPGRREIHHEMFDLLFTDEGRESALPPDRRVLYEFDGERRGKVAAANARRAAQAIASRNNQINNAAATAYQPHTTAATSNNANSNMTAASNGNANVNANANANHYTAPSPATINSFYYTTLLPATVRTVPLPDGTLQVPPYQLATVSSATNNILRHCNKPTTLNAYYAPHGAILIAKYLNEDDADTAAQQVCFRDNFPTEGYRVVGLTYEEGMAAWYHTDFRNIVWLGGAPWLLQGVPVGMAWVVPF